MVERVRHAFRRHCVSFRTEFSRHCQRLRLLRFSDCRRVVTVHDSYSMPGGMRYPEGRSLTARRRTFREGIRLRAGERFAAGEKSAVVGKDLWVGIRSASKVVALRARRAERSGGVRDACRTTPSCPDALGVELMVKCLLGLAGHSCRQFLPGLVPEICEARSLGWTVNNPVQFPVSVTGHLRTCSPA